MIKRRLFPAWLDGPEIVNPQFSCAQRAWQYWKRFGGLHAACAQGNLKRVLAVAEAHPEWINTPCGTVTDEFGGSDCFASGAFPLHFAARHGRNEIILVLVEKSAEIDAIDPQGKTPLVYACAFNRIETATCLLEDGADPIKPDNLGQLPLHWGIETLELTELLLDRTPDGINARNELGWTPLHCAAGRSKRAVIEFLVANGADLHARDNTGCTPTYHAAQEGNLDALAALVEFGADKNTPGHDGNTPLHAAVGTGCVHVVEFLIQHGAAVNAANRKGVTPLQEALTSELHPQAETIATLLREARAK